MRRFLARLLSLFRLRELDTELDEELRFHLDMATADNCRRGMTRKDAERTAQRAFGCEQQTKELYRDRRGLPMLELLYKDLRFGLRMIRRSPGFTAIAVLSLALGIGANTAIFTLIDAVMLRSLPVQSPDRLVSIGDVSRPGGLSNGGPRLDLFSYPLYQRLRDGNRVFSGLLASGRTGRLDARIADGAEEPLNGRLVSGNFFEVLGIEPTLGRFFTAEEDREPGTSPVVVISYGYWKKRFRQARAIAGTTLTLNGSVFTILGVGPRGFTGEVVGNPADVWIPLSMQAQINSGEPRLNRRDSSWLLLLGRLKPGVTFERARVEMRALATQALVDLRGPGLSPNELRDIRRQQVIVEPGGTGFSSLRNRFSQPLLTLTIIVGLVLLIACANVANLLLARAAARQKEISVRLALGASRGRLVRQLLTESVLLAAIGGSLGLLLAWGGSGLLLRIAAAGPNPIPLDVQPDGAMLAFTAVVAVLTGILFGLAPALRSTRIDLAPALKESARALIGNGGGQLVRLLVIAQVALSFLLLVGAGLLTGSLINLEAVDVGYSRANLAILRVDPAGSGYSRARQPPLTLQLIEHLSAIPGVLGVTVSENGMFSGTESSSGTLHIDGFSSTRKEDLITSVDQVGPRYFKALGVPLLAGRDFDEGDRVGSTRVAILNETMARYYFGNRDPIGKFIRDDSDPHSKYTIVGVAKDMKEGNLKGRTERRFYLPFLQITDPIEGFKFEIKTRGGSAQFISAIRRTVQSFDRNLRILGIEPVGSLIDASIAEERMVAQMSGFFGAVALLLAATGLYGVMSYATSRRVNEIALRMALGAEGRSVIRMVLQETLVLAVLGIAVGLPLELMATRLVSASLVGLSKADPATLVSSATVLLVVALFAGWVPARRVSRTDPMVALRQG